MAVALRLASDGDCPVSRAVRYVAVMRSTPLAASRGRNRDRLRRLGRIPRSVPRSEAYVFFDRTRPGEARICVQRACPLYKKFNTVRKEENDARLKNTHKNDKKPPSVCTDKAALSFRKAGYVVSPDKKLPAVFSLSVRRCLFLLDQKAMTGKKKTSCHAAPQICATRVQKTLQKISPAL